jgi:hypothetical protein
MIVGYSGTVAGLRSYLAELAFEEVEDDMTPWTCTDCGDFLPQCGTGIRCFNCKE